MSDINPGEELQNFLTQLYSSQAGDFLQRVDYDFMSDGDLYDLFFSSCINYILRRLITTAEYFRRKYPAGNYGEYRHREELRQYLRDYTRYKDKQIDDLLVLLNRCLSACDDEPTPHQKTGIKKQARQKGYHCYICGEELDYEIDNEYLSASVDHAWPRSMGGLSQASNLRVACRRCDNQNKKDFIDASDYHYEEISLVSASYDEYKSRERNRHYEVAVFAKTQFKCAVCDAPAHRVGTLHIGRKEPSDSWHFLNLVAYCSKHMPEE